MKNKKIKPAKLIQYGIDVVSEIEKILNDEIYKQANKDFKEKYGIELPYTKTWDD